MRMVASTEFVSLALQEVGRHLCSNVGEVVRIKNMKKEQYSSGIAGMTEDPPYRPFRHRMIRGFPKKQIDKEREPRLLKMCCK